MKTGQVAKDMMKDPVTVKAWAETEEFQQWFSEKARGLHGQRDFNEAEYDVLNTIRYLREQNRSPQEIAIELDKGFRTDEPPPGLATRSVITPANVYANQVALSRENEQLRTEVGRLTQQLQETTERLMRERMTGEKDLNREVGRLEAKIEMLQEQLEEMKQSRK